MSNSNEALVQITREVSNGLNTDLDAAGDVVRDTDSKCGRPIRVLCCDLRAQTPEGRALEVEVGGRNLGTGRDGLMAIPSIGRTSPFRSKSAVRMRV